MIFFRIQDVPHADQLRVMDLKTTDCKEKLPKIAHESLICTLAKDAENICQVSEIPSITLRNRMQHLFEKKKC